jgi:Fic family protein
VEGDRHSIAQQPELIQDPDERARREVENGFRQLSLANSIIRDHVKDPERPFRLAPRHLLQLNHAALEGIHPMAGAYRNTPVKIGGSRHDPPESFAVPEEVAAMCDYVNQNWAKAEAIHLSAYVLWKLNWIHPFADGNGRTARAVSYLVLSIRLDSMLPGTPTIPDQIASNKAPYYTALEHADQALQAGAIDLRPIEEMLSGMLAKQLISVFPAGAMPVQG